MSFGKRGINAASPWARAEAGLSEPLLFHRGLAENIADGQPRATLREIERAARLAMRRSSSPGCRLSTVQKLDRILVFAAASSRRATMPR
jgi:hypothetical protein